jgi:hypothetical protein
MKIKVKRKCDGKIGTVKSAFGTADGFAHFVVVFDEHIPSKKSKSSHFEIIGVSQDGICWSKEKAK